MIKFLSAIGLAVILMIPIALVDQLYDMDNRKKTERLTTVLIVYSFILSIATIYFVC